MHKMPRVKSGVWQATKVVGQGKLAGLFGARQRLERIWDFEDGGGKSSWLGCDAWFRDVSGRYYGAPGARSGTYS
jgi:hypothetical protein